jgi:RNA polymerase sigma-70 factor (ECF subfamily)
LALRTLCGFSAEEISRAFLTSEAAIAKRLTRARQKIRELAIPFEIPSGEQLSIRLGSVLQVLYLLFNEGYKASRGDSLIREELCEEAIRLTSLLTTHPSGDEPRTHALLALMLLNQARFNTRQDCAGRMLRLEEQDRSQWNQETIRRALRELARAAEGNLMSEYHLQAGIAACHCLAARFEDTDWTKILLHYDLWIGLNDSPVIALNRAVALAHVHGPQSGIAAVNEILLQRHLERYYLVYAVLGQFESQLGNTKQAAAHYRKALALTTLKSEQDFLRARLKEVSGTAGSE